MAVAAEDADATLTAGTGAENKAAEAEVEGGPKAENATVAAADVPVPNVPYGNDFAAAPWVTAKSTAFDADDPSDGGTLAPNDGALALKNLGNSTVAAADDTV